MELSEAKNPYDIFFKVFELDEASIPEQVMFDMMDLWESELWQWHSEVGCSSHEVSDVASYAAYGTTVKVFNTIDEIDTSKPIASIWANTSKRWYEDPETYTIHDYDELGAKLKSLAELSNVGHYGKAKEPWIYASHPIGYSPHNSEWFLVSYS